MSAMRNFLRLGARRGGADAGAAYAQRLVNVYGAQEVWRLTDIKTGTTIPATVAAARNGTLQGWTLQNTVSPVSGDFKAPYSDGSNDYGDITTASLTSLFNPAALSINIWIKTTDWTTNFRTAFLLLADGNNQVRIISTTGGAALYYIAGGTTDTRAYLTASTDWLMMTMTVDTVADEMKTYVNGGSADTQTGLGSWTGALGRAEIGAQTLVPSNVWDGDLAFAAVKFGLPVWTPAQVAAMYADAG